MSKSAKSFYTALTGIMFNVLSGVIGLIVTRLIISNYGSDFNGINSTANQLINMLLMVEGGFTLAISVSLFKPISENNVKMINGILSAASKIFKKIGLLFLVTGITISVLYSFVIKTNLPREIALLTFLMATISSAFNLYFAMKYRILLQTEQKEYILNSISTFTLMLTQSFIVLSVLANGKMLNVRVFIMIGAIVNSILIMKFCKRKYGFLDFNTNPQFDAIKGTKDVFIQKITSMLYTSVPIVFISASIGTTTASIYAVYNSVFLLLKNILYSFISAPRMGFGNLIAQRKKDYVYEIFLQYEMLVSNSLLWLLSVATVLIIPFIKLYTLGVSDTNYLNWKLAIILVLITFFEIVHVPSGNIINMSGNFKVAKTFQTIASVVLLVLLIIGNYFFGFYGILISVLLTSIILAIFEIYYVHRIYFEKKITKFLKSIIPQVLIVSVIIILEIYLLPLIDNYLMFFFVAFILSIINGILLVSYNLLFNLDVTKAIIIKIRSIILKKQGE